MALLRGLPRVRISHCLKGYDLDLDTVSTVRGSGWVRSQCVGAQRLRTHPLPRTVLTVSKRDVLTPTQRRDVQTLQQSSAELVLVSVHVAGFLGKAGNVPTTFDVFE